MTENFSDELHSLSERFDKSGLTFIHFKSIKNFILYFNKIRNESDRERIKNLLKSYFIEVDEIEKNKGIITPEDCKCLYLNFISPLGKYYKDHFDFLFAIRFSTIILAFVLDMIVYLFCIL